MRRKRRFAVYSMVQHGIPVYAFDQVLHLRDHPERYDCHAVYEVSSFSLDGNEYGRIAGNNLFGVSWRITVDDLVASEYDENRLPSAAKQDIKKLWPAPGP